MVKRYKIVRVFDILDLWSIKIERSKMMWIIKKEYVDEVGKCNKSSVWLYKPIKFKGKFYKSATRLVMLYNI